jgi:hypothetical protein
MRTLVGRAALALALAVPVASVASVASCARHLGTYPNVASPVAAPPALTTPVAAAAGGSPVAAARITTPMAGDPDDAALADARLLTTGCQVNEEARRALVQGRVDAMRAALDQEFRNWLDGVETCEAMRSRVVADGVGYGGLGLSGVGEGGGGRGEGIGLGTLAAHAFGADTKLASGTNNQVDGVDEADIVKNDGAYVYLAMNGALRIVDAEHARLLSVTRLPGTARNMLLERDRAVVFLSIGDGAGQACTYAYDCRFAGDGTSTRILVFDVKDRAHPKTVRRIDASGSLMAARRIGDAVHVVVADNDSQAPEYETWLDDLPDCSSKDSVGETWARFEKLKRDNERKIRAAQPRFPTLTDRGAKRELCEIMHTPLADGEAFTSVLSFDLDDDKAPVQAATIQSRPGAVFASEHGLYLSVVHRRTAITDTVGWYRFYASEKELSDVHKFTIGTKAESTRYVGSGVVPGHVLNQFAMDEWHDYLRVATSSGRVPDPSVESTVSVLAETESGSLVRVGAVEHVAPSEDIRAVRFDGDRAYVVTFKKTDPLFVLDLRRPDQPAILGELKLPGFSTYLHRIDPTHLLSIGYDADDQGSFAFFDGILLQLFDVTKPTEPVLLHREKIGTRGSSSAATTDHLAFTYLGERKLLALPMTICDGGGGGTFGDRVTFSGLLVYRVALDEGFTRLGGISHGTAGASCRLWWSDGRSMVKRSLFIDDRVFSISSTAMKVVKMGRYGEDVARIDLAP